MHLQLDSRPDVCDVSADGLALAFTATPGLEVVGTIDGHVAGLVVVAEVLSASHRVHLWGEDGLVAIEQVACVAGGTAGSLPAHATHDAAGHRLAFECERIPGDDATLAAQAVQLRDAGHGSDALVVSFPGHADALTSIRLLDDGWETWHLYPGHRPHAVRTRTTVATR